VVVADNTPAPMAKFTEDLTCPDAVIDIVDVPDWQQGMDAADYSQVTRDLI